MVLQSGIPPYEYTVRTLPFRVPDPTLDSPNAIGPSGILLEQAQFVITAERRRFRQAIDGHVLPTFNLYVNDNITPSGYNPKADGSTLSEFFPGAISFVDLIEETRTALEDLFRDFENDTDFQDQEIKADWLQNLYFAPSGFTPKSNGIPLGEYTHRFPSETGQVLVLSPDVLGSFGVLYDVDFGELMWNPYPYISLTQFGDAHGRLENGNPNLFRLQTKPMFPAFQTTAGNIVGLTNREPIALSDNYRTRHMSSGTVRLDGYMLTDLTKYRLGVGFNFGAVDDFTYHSSSTRSFALAQNFINSRVFLTPTAQASGVYKVVAINERNDYPNTAVESGVISTWPRQDLMWPANGNLAGTSTNLGYHVYNDAIWILDNSVFISNAKPSGLAALSPWTGHAQWVRYAELVNDASNGLNWPGYVGLERLSATTTYRVSPTIVKTITSVSGRIAFEEFDDNLDYVGETLTTSTVAEPINANEFPLAGGTVTTIADMNYDGTSYWVTNEDNVGFDLWRFNSSLDYTGQFIVISIDPVSTGTFNTRMAHVNGDLRVYFGSTSTGGILTQSGIFTVGSIVEPLEINSSVVGDAGVLNLDSPKIINGAPFFGHQAFAQIHDLFEVSGGTHVRDGVYCLIRFDPGGASTKGTYLLRIEEGLTTWEVVAIYHLLILNSSQSTVSRFEMLTMPIT